MTDGHAAVLLGEVRRLVEEVAHELETGNAGRGELAVQLREALALIDDNEGGDQP
jgi:hypothetical protein